jgi:hypothetical protein
MCRASFLEGTDKVGLVKSKLSRCEAFQTELLRPRGGQFFKIKSTKLCNDMHQNKETTMNKLLFALSLTSTIAFTGVAEAKNCPTSYSRSACATFLRQQDAPALTGPIAKTKVLMRSIAVLSDEPSAIVLRKGDGNDGPQVLSFRKATLDWRQTDRGWETTVYVPVDIFKKNKSLSLCGANGHSSWKAKHIAYLKRANVGSSDSACVGSDGWCAQYGL